jgi:hypothetical protein
MTMWNDGHVLSEGEQKRPESKRLYPTICLQEIQTLHPFAVGRELRRCRQPFEVERSQEIALIRLPQYRLDFCLP